MNTVYVSYWKRMLALVALASFFIGSAAWGMPTSAAAAVQKEKKGKKSKKSQSTAAPQANGTPKLWEDRGEISNLDLYWGLGGEQEAPKPPFQFEKEDVTGTNPKIKVIDANGVRWNVKFDEEVQCEVASSRIVWALGYMVEENYFIPSGKIEGVTGLRRAKNFVRADGSFTRAMFEKRPDTIARRNLRWSWESNPFVGTKEMSGLAIVNTFLNNWDAKVDNNNVLGMYAEDGTTIHDWYVQSDWGGTLGKTGGYFTQSKWDIKDFSKQAFIDGVSGNTLKLHYTGRMGSSMKNVPLDHAKWFAGIIGKLTDKQIEEAFRAAGATPEEMKGFTARLRQKINELTAAVGR